MGHDSEEPKGGEMHHHNDCEGNADSLPFMGYTTAGVPPHPPHQQVEINSTRLLQPLNLQHLTHQHLGHISTNPATLAAAAAVASSLYNNATSTNSSGFLASFQPHQQSFFVNSFTGHVPYPSVVNSSLVMSSLIPSQQQISNQTHVTPILPNFCTDTTMYASTSANEVDRTLSQSGHGDGSGGSKTSSDHPDNYDDRKKKLRGRNRENARSTRLRKKAYIQELKELVENLQSERKEEMRQRHVAVQRTADIWSVRRNVVLTFCRYHASYENNQQKWSTILEDTFWLKQPVTPFRSFRRAEVEKEYRFSRGLEAVVNDAASLSVMIECIGCQSPRWVHLKREEFLRFEEKKRYPGKKISSCIERQDIRVQHALSSLSASSDSSNEDENTRSTTRYTRRIGETSFPSINAMTRLKHLTPSAGDSKTNKVSSSSGGSGGSRSDGGSNGSNDYHDYHAKPLPDPKCDDNDQNNSDVSPCDEYPAEESNGFLAHENGKRPTCIDSTSSGDDSAPPVATKRRKSDPAEYGGMSSNSTHRLPSNIGIIRSCRSNDCSETDKPSQRLSQSNINGHSFVESGKRKAITSSKTAVSQPSATSKSRSNDAAVHVSNNISVQHAAMKGPHLIAADAATESSDSGYTTGPQIKGQYHINVDDILLTEDILMCPFVFRSHDAVRCGAFSECVMPGMLRAHFSARNKLQSLELVYDAMGFMQQLERASGMNSTSQIIPESLDMALSSSFHEARVVTLAHPPYLIVSVNEVWTRVTGDSTIVDAKTRRGRPAHLLERVTKGQPACSTNIHYDKDGRDFIEFVCSYPLTNSADEVTHLLHVSKELPSFESLQLQAKVSA